ncbi:MAG: 30S ribosomal protein S9 [Desulfobacterales bacterium]
MEQSVYYATGRRKSATARTYMTPGSGTINVNGRPMEEYFCVPSARKHLLQPLELTNTAGQYDIRIRVQGGGIKGQAGAVRHGITRALMLINPEYRTPLKRAGFVRRDDRVKERKKYGQKGARARFQFSKR